MGLYTKIIDLQKLGESWRNIYRNKPKQGVDNITCEEFEAHKNEYLKELFHELNNQSYECQPVKLVPIYKGEKVRYISLFCMRDKVIQGTLAAELKKIYEHKLSNSSYAYRSGKSALTASQKIQEYIAKVDDGYVLKTDIKSFFDKVQHDKLRKILQRDVKDGEVLDLITRILKPRTLEETGELVEKRVGLYQGSGISPVLSNIYLAKFDATVEGETAFYVRYSDDMILMFETKEGAERYCHTLKLYLEEYGLELNMEKTGVYSLEEGFEFLGYRFDKNGISIPDKAEQQLAERLESVWLSPDIVRLDQKFEKCMEILGGWEQYFRSEREPKTMIEYAVWVRQMIRRRNIDIEKMQIRRLCLLNPYKDIALYLGEIWKKEEMIEEELREYEQFLGIDSLDTNVSVKYRNPQMKDLARLLREYLISETQETQVELIQIYADLKMYRKSELLMERKKTQAVVTEDTLLQFSKNHMDDLGLDQIDLELNEENITRYMDLFVAREDLYAVDSLNSSGKRECQEVAYPVYPETIKEHLSGKITLNTYIQRPNQTVKYLVIDADISKSILLRCTGDELFPWKEKCFQIILSIKKKLEHWGISGYIEDSGNRGYHLWVFFEEWIQVRYANMLTDLIDRKMMWLWKEGNIQIEYFPNKTRIRNGKRGQTIKIPWGIHCCSGRRSFFVDEEGQCMDQLFVLDSIAKCSLNTIRKVLSSEQDKNIPTKICEVDNDITAFEIRDESVQAILQSCNLIRYLCQKARKTNYLTHFERLSLLYVLGHAGENGKELLHKIMSYTLNYSHQTTEKFIRKCPDKPISCVKLREQYKQISAEVGCTCSFKRAKNCYPSPVLHALRYGEEENQVTVPTTRTVNVKQEQKIKNEINIVEHVQTLAEKLMELRKQKRGLNKSIQKCEMELTNIFDDNNTDSIEIKMGILTRRTTQQGIEWIVEL